jgi:small ligand-binding sensory domain FIST
VNRIGIIAKPDAPHTRQVLQELAGILRGRGVRLLADRETGALAVGAYPRVGQTVQFQMRDPEAADEDLRLLLESALEALGDLRPAGALLCTCNGRGVGLFGVPDHDARLLANRFDGVPIAGFFCNGEIGPVGSRNFLHGFTASIALVVPR